MRALIAGDGPIAHHVPAPFLHCGPLDPSGLVIGPHWESRGPAPGRDPARPHPAARSAPVPPHPRAPRPLPGAGRMGGGSRSRVGGLRVHPVRGHRAARSATPTTSSPSGAACRRSSRPSDGTDGEHFRWYLGELEDRPFVLTVGGSDIRKGTERLISAVGQLVKAGFDLRSPRDRRADARSGSTRLDEAAAGAGMTGTGRARRRRRGRAPAGVLPTGRGHGHAVAGRRLRPARARVRRLRHPRPGLGDHGPGRSGRHPPGHLRPRRHRRGGAGHRRSALRRRAPGRRSSQAQRALASQLDVGRGGEPGGGGRRPHGRPASLRRRGLRLTPPHARGAGGTRFHLSAAGSPSTTSGSCSAVDGDAARSTPSRLCTRRLRCPSASAISPSTPSASTPARPRTTPSSTPWGTPTDTCRRWRPALRYPGWIWLHEVRLPAIAVTALDVARRRRLRRSLAWLLERSYPGRAPHLAARHGPGARCATS